MDCWFPSIFIWKSQSLAKEITKPLIVVCNFVVIDFYDNKIGEFLAAISHSSINIVTVWRKNFVNQILCPLNVTIKLFVHIPFDGLIVAS